MYEQRQIEGTGDGLTSGLQDCKDLPSLKERKWQTTANIRVYDLARFEARESRRYQQGKKKKQGQTMGTYVDVCEVSNSVMKAGVNWMKREADEVRCLVANKEGIRFKLWDVIWL